MKKGAPVPGTAGQPAQSPKPSEAGQKLRNYAHNSAGKQAHSAPKAEYQRPHRVHVSAEARIAAARHHAAEMEDEARRNAVRDAANNAAGVEAAEKEEERRIEGLNFDEKRKKRGKRQQNEEDRDDHEDAEEAVALGQAAAAKGFAKDEGAGKYFQDVPQDRMGDLELSDPNEMKRLLGPSVRFAKHAMLLAEEKLKVGIPRDEVVEFLASLYLGVADRAYANKALREFGAGTGIIDLYPLEVMEHLLQNVPTFFNRVSKGRFFTSAKTGAYQGETGKPIILTYDPELRIRGFALKNGAKPGYVFEPVDPPGTYHLTFRTAGTFTVMVSAIAKSGAVVIEELEVKIAEGKSTAFDDAAAIKREKKHEADQAAEDARAAGDAEGAPTPKKDELPTKDELKISFPRRI